MSRIHRKNHIKGTNSVPEFNVSKVRAISNREVEKQAKGDPDSPIVTSSAAKKMKPKKRSDV